MKAGDVWGHPTQGPWCKPHLLESTKAELASGVLWPGHGPQPGVHFQTPSSTPARLAALLALWVDSLATAHSVPPASSPVPPPWVCLCLVCLLQEALADRPSAGLALPPSLWHE